MDEFYHLFEVPIWSSVNEVYDSSTDEWETKTPMPETLINIKANVVNDTIHILDGKNNWFYDPASDSWSKKAAPSLIGGCSSAAVDEKIYSISSYWPIQIYDTLNGSLSQGARSPRIAPEGVAAATAGVFAPKRIYLFAVAEYGWVPYGKTDIYASSRRTTLCL